MGALPLGGGIGGVVLLLLISALTGQNPLELVFRRTVTRGFGDTTKRAICSSLATRRKACGPPRRSATIDFNGRVKDVWCPSRSPTGRRISGCSGSDAGWRLDGSSRATPSALTLASRV